MDWDQISDKLSGVGENVGKGLKRLFGSRNARYVSDLTPLVKAVNAEEGWAQGLSADEFKAWTESARAKLKAEEVELEDLIPKAFALVREASVRTLGLRHYDVQIVGGIVLHRGSVAEMMTGEGKTLVATLPLYLNCLTGRPSYLVTVNDYLARRDADWMRPIYEYLGCTVGAIQSTMAPNQRHPEYACNIIYGTNNEFGFDYLRDNMKLRVEDQVQKDLFYAIVDEVDSILIDEARTPLIISGPAEEATDKYRQANSVAKALVRDEHYEVKEKERTASLLEVGIEVAQKLIGVDSFYTPGNEDWPHFIENAIRAHEVYAKDREYVVEEGERGLEVVIVDEFTGRKMTGRRWSDGLHQAVETKEGLPPRQENQTLATITFQNYFRLFDKLAGMTGTALTEANEFLKVYELDTVAIPTNLPLARVDVIDTVYRTEPEKWSAIVEEIGRVHHGCEAELDEKGREINPAYAGGQPILVGTTSVENSEKLSNLLKAAGIPHEVLNAKNHEREAHIVANAGCKGAVTVSTNMAGRGTDIKLGGNMEYRLRMALEERELREGDVEHLEEIDQIRQQVREQSEADEQEVLGLGGLYVLGTERHEARRIDNQLRGRSGRQGNAGRSRFFLSLEDPLMRRFYRDWVKNFMQRLGMEEGVPIESRMVTRAIEKAQKKVEDYNFEIRKNLLEYDEVMDQQRKTVYTVRQEVLERKGLEEKVDQMLVAVLNRASETWTEDAQGFQGWFHRTFGFDATEAAVAKAVDEEPDIEAASSEVKSHYDARREKVGDEPMQQVERWLLLEAIDSKWKDHLHAVDALKTGIGLRGYGQVDPKNEYKREGFELFGKLLAAVEDQVSSLILRIRLRGEDEEGQAELPETARRAQQVNYHGPAKTQTREQAVRAARTQLAKRQVAQRRVSAAQAFDLAKRQRQVAAAREAQAKAAEAQAAVAEAEATGEPAAAPAEAPKSTAQAEAKPAAPAAARSEPVVPPAGRNDPCPCGSGKKYKKCHGR